MDIVQQGSINSIIMSPTALSGSDTTGFAANVDTTVAKGDLIYFNVNNGGSGNNSNDTITWAPNIVYTSSADNGGDLLSNPTFSSNLSSWTEYGSPVSAITVPSAGETQMYSSSAPVNVSLGQSVSVPSGSAFTASVITNTGLYERRCFNCL